MNIHVNNMNVIEDEIHLLYCSKYFQENENLSKKANERNHIFEHLSDIDKIDYLFI